MHCHSTASELAKLGIQQSLGLPECATPPQEVYELAKRRGMDFVTITDHDTIDGCLEIADRPDVFISEELTAAFVGEPQQVHILCYGITPEDHEWLQANAGDLEDCAAYLHDREITCALAHPFFAVAAPLTPAPPSPARPALPDLGGAQRLPGARAEHARRGLYRDPRWHRDRGIRRSRRHRHRADLYRGSARFDAGRRFWPTSARAMPRAEASRARPRSGRTRPSHSQPGH